MVLRFIEWITLLGSGISERKLATNSLEVRTRPFNFHSCLKLPEYNGLTIGNEYFNWKTGKRNFKSISNF